MSDIDTRLKEQAILNRVYNETDDSLTVSSGGYGISNIEETGTYKYFGFEGKSGSWYIMRKTLADNVFLYVSGESDYTTAWTNRASQTYVSYANAF